MLFYTWGLCNVNSEIDDDASLARNAACILFVVNRVLQRITLYYIELQSLWEFQRPRGGEEGGTTEKVYIFL